MADVHIRDALKRLKTTRATLTKWILQRKLRAFWKLDSRGVRVRHFKEREIAALESQRVKRVMPGKPLLLRKKRQGKG